MLGVHFSILGRGRAIFGPWLSPQTNPSDMAERKGGEEGGVYSYHA